MTEAAEETKDDVQAEDESGPASPPEAETAAAAEHDPLELDAHAIEHMQEHVRIYIAVFVALAVFTAITVGVAYLGEHLGFPTFLSVLIALVLATIKGSLVACYFMHLINERKAIYWVLALTALFFVVLMSVPTGHETDPGPNADESPYTQYETAATE